MKFTVKRKLLEEELAYVSNVLTRGFAKDGLIASKLTLTVASTGELELRGNSSKGELVSFVDCESYEPGVLVVPSYTFGQLVRLLPDENFAGESVKARLKVVWSSGSALLAGVTNQPKAAAVTKIEHSGSLF